jgi:AraC-like DNA-binding protein
MILAPLSNPLLRAVVLRAALPEEDVVHRLSEVALALRLGFPRLMVFEPDDPFNVRRELEASRSNIPVLPITGATVRDWKASWHAQGLAVRRIDDSAMRLRTLIRKSVGSSSWVDGVFADLVLLLGRGLPAGFKGFARRVMEYPARYSSLADLRHLMELSPGALKARFRRRGLPSPAAYLRWFRLISGARLLSDPTETTLSVSFRLGFSSDGNFCRWVQSNAGCPPSALRRWEGRALLLFRLAAEGFPDGALDAWTDLGCLFLRRVG